jgi:hypothetical protein
MCIGSSIQIGISMRKAKYWEIVFKNGTSKMIAGYSFQGALINSRLKPFLVIDVESITELE